MVWLEVVIVGRVGLVGSWSNPEIFGVEVKKESNEIYYANFRREPPN